MMQEVSSVEAQVRIKLAITTAAFTTLNASCMPARIGALPYHFLRSFRIGILYDRITVG